MIEVRIVKNPNKELKDFAISLVTKTMSRYNKTPFLRHVKSRSIQNKSNKYVFCFDNDKAIGFCTVRIFNDILYVYEIHVSEDYQNKGVGSKMILLLKENFNLSQNIKKHVLYVYKDNENAISFYIKHKFKINKKSKCDQKYFEMVFEF